MDLQNRRDKIREIGNIGEDWVLKYLNNNRILHHYSKYKADEFKEEFYDYDFYIDLFGGVTLEVKYDNYSCQTNNFAIETRSRMKNQGISQYKYSGILRSTADYFLFLQPSTYNAGDVAYFWLIGLENLKHCTFWSREFPDSTFNHLSWDKRNVLKDGVKVLNKTVRHEKEVFADTGTVQELWYVPVKLIQTECKAFGNIEGFNINFLK